MLGSSGFAVLREREESEVGQSPGGTPFSQVLRQKWNKGNQNKEAAKKL